MWNLLINSSHVPGNRLRYVLRSVIYVWFISDNVHVGWSRNSLRSNWELVMRRSELISQGKSPIVDVVRRIGRTSPSVPLFCSGFTTYVLQRRSSCTENSTFLTFVEAAAVLVLNLALGFSICDSENPPTGAKDSLEMEETRNWIHHGTQHDGHHSHPISFFPSNITFWSLCMK